MPLQTHRLSVKTTSSLQPLHRLLTLNLVKKMPLAPPVISLFQFNSFHAIYIKKKQSSICFLFGNHSGTFDNPQFQCKFPSLFLFPIIYTAFSFVLDRLSSLSMDFHQSRPILQLAESSHKTHIVRVPAYAFSRLVSPSLLSFCSPF